MIAQIPKCKGNVYSNDKIIMGFNVLLYMGSIYSASSDIPGTSNRLSGGQCILYIFQTKNA